MSRHCLNSVAWVCALCQTAITMLGWINSYINAMRHITPRKGKNCRQGGRKRVWPQNIWETKVCSSCIGDPAFCCWRNRFAASVWVETLGVQCHIRTMSAI